MAAKQPLNLQMIVADVLKEWPQVIPVFLRHRMNCVGCDLSAFETLQDASQEYGLPADAFLHELNEALPLPE